MTETTSALPQGGIIELPVTQVMNSSYLDYAMSVITSRALPDVRDGLKPVHRRVLFAMHELGLLPNRAYKKSARVVGDVIGKYHPHGDSAVYDAAVRMAQPWSMRHPLIDGQGNFGSMDGDGAAAMRYTEMRMTHFGAAFFDGIEKETVDFAPNYDGSEHEPSVLPVALPNIWINGTEGIAVGMATAIPTHNLRETVAALLAFVDNREISIAEIAKLMPGPDFPTGGIVHDLDGYISALESGRGRVKIRAKWHEESLSKRGNRSAIVIDEFPYQVNKAKVVEKIAELVKEKSIEGIADLRDESSKEGIRVVIELKTGVSAELIFNQLITMTELEKSYSYNCMLLDGGRPRQLGIHDIFDRFVTFRLDVIKRAAEFDLRKAQARLHILDGFLKALDRLDETIKTIRAAKNQEDANQALQALLSIDEIQAKAILDMRLHRLTSLAIADVRAEHADLLVKIDDLNDIIAREPRRIEIMKADLVAAAERFGDERRSEIAHGLSALTREDLIEKEDVLIPVTNGGYLKRTPLAALAAQNRGTRGRNWMSVGEDDFVVAVHAGSTHDYLLAVTDSGQVHAVKAFQIPEGGAGTKGRHFRNVFEGVQGNLMKILSATEFSDDLYLLTLTAKGLIKRTPLSDYRNSVRMSGIQGVRINEGDRIVAAGLCRDNDHVVIVSDAGKAIRFEINQKSLRPMGRVSAGNIAMRVSEGTEVIGMVIVPHETIGTESEPQILCIGSQGVGKRTPVEDFPTQHRGGQGVICFNLNRKTGDLVRALGVTEDQDLVLFGDSGGANRIRVKDVRQTGRAAAGVILMSNNGAVVDAVAVPAAEEGATNEEEPSEA